MPDTSPVYHSRRPQESQYYQCVEDNFENLEQVYDDQFAKKYGYFRPYIKQVIYRYLDCGILHNGFGVSRWSLTCEEVLKDVPHRHFVFSIPKILRRYFLYDRKLLSDLSRCAWETLKEFFKESVPEENAVPGCGSGNSHFRRFFWGGIPASMFCTRDGCFYGNGMFRVAPLFEIKHLEEIFRHKVF